MEIPALANAISGALGSVIANTIIYPLDIVKTRMQVQNKLTPNSTKYKSLWDGIQQIYREEGWKGLYWNGLGANLVGVASSNFAYFYFYGMLRKIYEYYHKKLYSTAVLSTAWELLLGAHAAAVSQLFTIPVSVVVTRQQTSRPSKRLSVTCAEIIQEEGLIGLWKGLIPSLILVVNPSITYGFFEKMKRWLIERKGGQPLTSLEVFLIGAASKTLATIVTYPYIMAKVRMQWSSKQNNEMVRYTSTLDTLAKIYKADGLFGWYKGMKAQILKAVTAQALLLMIKEKSDWYSLLFYLYMHRLMNPFKYEPV